VAETGRDPQTTAGEIVIWLLFFALLVPAGVVGWAIGHSSAGGTRTVTQTIAASTAKTTTAKTTTQTAPPPSAAGNAAKGKAVFLANACGSCHTFEAAGSTGKIGPDLDTKPSVDAKKENMALAAFVRESIVKPNAYVSPGYPKGVMPQTFGKQLSQTQLADLVAFITTGK
jgi:mono/diheme cytochrome c family protein